MTWHVMFFFKQKTAYEMRISDWSSDVCSSDISNYAPGFSSAALIAVVTLLSMGSIFVPNAVISRPSRPIRYLWKFHLGMFAMPSSAAAHLYRGIVFGPTTSLFSARGSLMPNLEIGRAHV